MNKKDQLLERMEYLLKEMAKDTESGSTLEYGLLGLAECVQEYKAIKEG